MSRSWFGVRFVAVVCSSLLLLCCGPASATLQINGDNLVVTFGTYDATLTQCFFDMVFAGMFSPHTVSFSNPAAKAITYIIVEANQSIDLGGITASITTGTVGTSTAITLQVTSTPKSNIFLNNVQIRMYCAA
ncbi:uncharacterized protein LOC131215871 [Anopheles bellator]|uniref:uncharacterized protein LOC131215871 n=1 Tax=Anopheles bellator TaxID=139047 RepID=UPI0026471CC5|nr:uncharacterized protein LOC131215871 [Anopheles bellator]